MKAQLIDLLEEYVTDNKKELISAVLSQRTRHITVVLEDLYHAHNVSAVIRTCDCFGIQDVHITQQRHEYNVNPNIVRGASKWVTLQKFENDTNSTQNCLNELKNKGYKLIGTTPDPNSVSIDQLSIEEPMALIFGTEKDGLSDYAKGQLDEMVHIPMYGFTESFNISVSAALILRELVQQLKSSEIDWKLSEEEKEVLKLEWYKNIVKRSDLHIANFLEKSESGSADDQS